MRPSQINNIYQITDPGAQRTLSRIIPKTNKQTNQKPEKKPKQKPNPDLGILYLNYRKSKTNRRFLTRVKKQKKQNLPYLWKNKDKKP